MTESQLKTQTPNIEVEYITQAMSFQDLSDLCDATDAAIENGGGFGWVDLPVREGLERYWQGVITAPTRLLFVARLDSTICGTTQVVIPPKNNEAQSHVVHLTTNFLAPWARGYGVAKLLLETVESYCKENGYAVINLDVRETMDRAIEVYEGLGYQKFGEHPYSVKARNQIIKSLYYYKVINPDFFE